MEYENSVTGIESYPAVCLISTIAFMGTFNIFGGCHSSNFIQKVEFLSGPDPDIPC